MRTSVSFRSAFRISFPTSQLRRLLLNRICQDRRFVSHLHPATKYRAFERPMIVACTPLLVVNSFYLELRSGCQERSLTEKFQADGGIGSLATSCPETFSSLPSHAGTMPQNSSWESSTHRFEKSVRIAEEPEKRRGNK